MDKGHLVLLSALTEGRDLEAEKALATTLPGIHVKHHHHEAVQFAGTVYTVYIAYFTTEKKTSPEPKEGSPVQISHRYLQSAQGYLTHALYRNRKSHGGIIHTPS